MRRGDGAAERSDPGDPRERSVAWARRAASFSARVSSDTTLTVGGDAGAAGGEAGALACSPAMEPGVAGTGASEADGCGGEDGCCVAATDEELGDDVHEHV